MREFKYCRFDAMLGGYFAFDPINASMLLNFLPKMIRLHPTDAATDSVAVLVELIQREARERRAGRALVLNSDRLLVTSLDVTSLQSISDAISKGIDRFGRIDVVVSNAGIGLLGAHEVMSDEVIREVFETNTFGVMAVNRAIARHMRERGSGTTIHVTSSAGIAPHAPGCGLYGQQVRH